MVEAAGVVEAGGVVEGVVGDVAGGGDSCRLEEGGRILRHLSSIITMSAAQPHTQHCCAHPTHSPRPIKRRVRDQVYVMFLPRGGLRAVLFHHTRPLPPPLCTCTAVHGHTGFPRSGLVVWGP